MLRFPGLRRAAGDQDCGVRDQDARDRRLQDQGDEHGWISHVEGIADWEPDRRIRLHMRQFSPPLSRLATRFDEAWEFSRIGRDTRIVRSFESLATSRVTRPILWLISILLKRAIARQMRQKRQFSNGGAT